jgi:predicted RNase H-like nuclease (RuvC/YqgF family)
MLAAFDFTPLITGIISFVFGGGLIAAVVALYKVKPEAGQIVVTAAQGALLVQTGVIENLQREIQRLGTEVESLKVKLSERDSLIMQLQTQLLSVTNNQTRHDTEIRGKVDKT